MDLSFVDRIVSTVLYEGYILYPYRPTSVKNQQRFNFGALYPEAHCLAQRGADASKMHTECLVLGRPETTLAIKVRFLHLRARNVGIPTNNSVEGSQPEFDPVDELEIDGLLLQSWHEAVERYLSLDTLNLSQLCVEPRRLPFLFPATQQIEYLRDDSGAVAALIERKQEILEGSITVEATRLHDQLFKLSVAISNDTQTKVDSAEPRQSILAQSLLSTHTILGVQEGEFISLIDPPEAFQGAAESCRNIGTWPVLVGEHGERDCILSSPIILYDYPQVAPESPGDLFDGTEIDEILTLRIMTLTDAEKRQMRAVDERARKVLERTETLQVEQLVKMHGTLRSLRRVEEKRR